MSTFFAAPGTIYHIDVYNAPKKFELKLPVSEGSPFFTQRFASSSFGTGATSPIAIITGFSINENEVTAKSTGLENSRMIYGFGKGFGDISVTFDLLLGTSGEDNKSSMETDFRALFQEARLGNAEGEQAQLSTNTGALINFHITGLKLGGYLPEIEVMSGSIIGVLGE
tara:strand:- start:6844 stop:7350 length:507 start_codon:yes stop_codon:yes gene_type:complete